MKLPRYSDIINNVTLEPTLFMYFVTLTLSGIGGQHLLLEKACHPLNSSPPIVDSDCDAELRAVKEVTHIQIWRDTIRHLGLIFFVLFAGPWSDNYINRRKPLMYLPLCGQILTDLFCILNIYFWRWSPIVTALGQCILLTLSGWRTCFMVGAYSYIADITSETSRTKRIGVFYCVYFLANPLGAVIFGFLFHDIGFYGIFSLCVALNIAAILYLILFVDESKISSTDDSNLESCNSIFSLNHVSQSLKTALKHREGYKRAVVILMVFASPMMMATFKGEYSVLYFFLRIKFGWDEVAFGFFSAFKSISIFFGTLITLGLFSHLLNVSDSVIAMISMVALIVSALGNAFAAAPWEMFVYQIVDFMHGASGAVLRSIISKCVEPNEQGQVNSIVEIADSLYSLINTPLYNAFYHYTFPQMPGAFFLLSALHGSIALLVFLILYILQRKERQLEFPALVKPSNGNVAAEKNKM